MLHNISAVEVNVFHQCAAVIAVKNYVLLLTRRPAPLHDHANCVRRPLGRMRYVRRNEEGLAFVNNVVDDPITLANADFDVPLQLIKILFRIDQVKIVPRVWSFNHHHEEVAAIIEVLIADRRSEVLAVRLDPTAQMNGRLHDWTPGTLRR